MKKLLVLLLILFGISTVANADIIASFVTGTTGYQQLYDSTTLASGAWKSLAPSDMNGVHDVGQLPNGDVVIAYRTGSSDYLQIFDGTTLADGVSTVLDGVKSVSGLADGNVAATYTNLDGNDVVQIFDGTTLAAGVSLEWDAGDTLKDVTGLTDGNIVLAYNAGGSKDYVEIYDTNLTTSGSAWMDQVGIERVTGMANGDVAVYYGAGTNYLQIFSGDGAWTGGAWIAHQQIKDIGGTSVGDIAVAYTSGSTYYLQIFNGETLASDGAWVAISTIRDIDGDYLKGVGTCGDNDHPYPAGDLNTDCVTDNNDLLILVQKWLECTDPTGSCLDLRDNWNFSAPEIAPITIDGDLSDWAESSGFITFNGWMPDSNGLASTSRAQYAWNDTANKLYIGIETTQDSGDLVVEVGGLMGIITDYVSPVNGKLATQLEFDPTTVPGSVDPNNETLGGLTTGISAYADVDGGTVTIEIETPILTDWTYNANFLDLSAGMHIYAYANVKNQAEDTGDSQISDGNDLLNVDFFTEWVTVYDSKILLVEGMTDCGVQGYLDEDINQDCTVNFEDYVEIGNGWLTCNKPECD